MQEYIDKSEPLFSVKEVKEKLQEDHELSVKTTKLSAILLKQLGMRYRRIKGTSW